ncbi:MAG TPA: DNA polymerase [Bacteroidota bacterium]|jgi:DNA polymerase-4|nr:DNA polymerase [Bacteroidota bacterium]
MSLRYLFVDFNAYFASVEQQLRPELRGKPVVVVPMLADSTSCIAASYEAKKYGIKTGTRVGDARRLCPGLQLVEARHTNYIEYHHKLIEAVESCIPVDRVLSIDEMICELTGTQQQRGNAVKLAHHIKETISLKVGSELRCSIGIAPNPFLSKTASDMQKPNGLTVIELSDLPHCLYRLELSDFCGIGNKMLKRINRQGIYTVKELCSADVSLLRDAWGGIEGDRMHANLRGEVVTRKISSRASVGHSHVLPPVQRTAPAAFAVLHRLLQKAATRLRNYGLTASGMRVSLKYLNGKKWGKDISFSETQDTVQLLQAFSGIWKQRKFEGETPLAVGVTLFKLNEEKYHTLSLFNGERLDAFNKAIDVINKKYGKNTVYFAGAHDYLSSAPMRIAFNHIPDIAIEGDE